MNDPRKRIYLDYAASTPVDPGVFRAMEPYFMAKFGNPGSLHSFGQEAIAVTDKSRETIAKAIGAEFREIVFTASATEANNLALQGVMERSKGKRIIISSIEHESIIETARELEKKGAEVIHIPVDKEGTVDLKKIKESLTENTALVSVMYANNEIGTIQPIREIAEIIKNFRKENIYPLFHTDAAQAFQFIDCDVNKLGVDMMTLSSHKIYGPKGAGALYIRGNAKAKVVSQGLLSPIEYGGGQEFGLRSGTENVPAIVGFAKAVELLGSSREAENKKIAELRDRLWKGIKEIDPTTERQTPENSALPNILNVYFPKYKAEHLLTKFDLGGLAASSGSACRSRGMELSYVIEAIGYSKERAKSSVRFSLGRPTTAGEIDDSLKIIKKELYN